ncbi:D-hexose-6-phosphate mutarotase [Acidovorax sp. SUPP3334]|uniref:D-hexose-6-phosphate mutarotase n=1 Tax=Acidovorax sp. SUPP3334 TaxID=2920881 RepID=UPI0023DE294C|nr:D-hexose-6-phosphate mutarotase [Acidovorax sp. SUPP3334]GKT21484.1 D-hexose-6-phosphate mutarotase [Acidovorax sp. SUPP3334]
MPANLPAPPSVRPLSFHGQPAMQLALPTGETATVALQGAQVLSWTGRGGAERMYFSPRARLDGHSPIRGGIPVCFPQFNQRGPLAKHGFVRNLPWRLESRSEGEGQGDGESGVDAGVDAGVARAVFALDDTAETRAWWPHGFAARLTVELSAEHLLLDLAVRNTGTTAWDFTAALHGYYRVSDIAATRVEGLDGRPRWDSVADVHSVQQGPVAFDGEYDAIFSAAATPLRLHAGDHTLSLAQSPSWINTVVWNPGAALCATLPDMPADGYRHMVCVEAACIDQPVHLEPGAGWSGWQRLRAD